MFGIGFGEILIIALLALILFGQEDLPANIRKAANGLKEFRKVTSSAQRAWTEVRSDMTRMLIEESDKELSTQKEKPASALASGMPQAPDSALEIVEGERAQDDDHHHHHHGDDEPHSHADEPVAPVVIKAPEGIIAQGTHLDDGHPPQQQHAHQVSPNA